MLVEETFDGGNGPQHTWHCIHCDSSQSWVCQNDSQAATPEGHCVCSPLANSQHQTMSGENYSTKI